VSWAVSMSVIVLPLSPSHGILVQFGPMTRREPMAPCLRRPLRCRRCQMLHLCRAFVEDVCFVVVLELQV
jgi:hypothetical protein